MHAVRLLIIIRIIIMHTSEKKIKKKKNRKNVVRSTLYEYTLSFPWYIYNRPSDLDRRQTTVEFLNIQLIFFT